jgi:hypothetical protein
VPSEDVDEFLALRSRLAVLCVLLWPVDRTQKSWLSENFKSITDIQMWQAISQASIGQPEKFHTVVSAGRV